MIKKYLFAIIPGLLIVSLIFPSTVITGPARAEKAQDNTIKITENSNNSQQELLSTMLKEGMKEDLMKAEALAAQKATEQKATEQKAPEQEAALENKNRMKQEIINKINSGDNFKTEELEFLYKPCSEDITEIIQKVYSGNLMNFDKILQFGYKLQYFLNKYMIYDALYEQMAEHGHLDSFEIFDLAFNLKSQIFDKDENPSGTIADEAYQLKNKFYSGVQKLVWGSYVRFWSDASQGYLDSNPYDHMLKDPKVMYTFPNLPLNWIPIKITASEKYFRLYNSVSAYSLDCGPYHARSAYYLKRDEFYDNRYIRWRIAPRKKGQYYIVQCHENGKFLDGGPHHANYGSPDYNRHLQWQIE